MNEMINDVIVDISASLKYRKGPVLVLTLTAAASRGEAGAGEACPRTWPRQHCNITGVCLNVTWRQPRPRPGPGPHINISNSLPF